MTQHENQNTNQAANQSIQLLQEIIRAARDGAEGLSLVMEKTDNQSLRQLLSEEKKQYAAAEQEAGEQLINHGGQADPESMMNRAGMWMGMQMNTLMDKSPSHLAELLMQGNIMGIVSLIRTKNSLPNADQASINLFDRMIALQSDMIEQAKAYL